MTSIHEENPHEELDRILRDVAEECIPEVHASDEYKEVWAERVAYLDMLKAKLTEAQWHIFAKFVDKDNYAVSLEEDEMLRKIFLYGLSSGIEIGRRSENGRTKRAANI